MSTLFKSAFGKDAHHSVRHEDKREQNLAFLLAVERAKWNADVEQRKAVKKAAKK